MQVLTSGSFINLDNQEKIKRLIFTAKEIAFAAAGANGFNNEEESNRNFADEIWQSAEYMCREHEAARVKAIFTNAFLERLRELRSAATEARVEVTEVVSQDNMPKLAEETETPRDEFLGIVSEETSGENNNAQEQNSVVESTNQIAAAENEFVERQSESEENFVGDDEDLRFAQTEQSSASAPIENEIGDETEVEIGDIKAENADEANDATAVADADSTLDSTAAVGALRLPDKEPYRWDKCTVTATIQLLPTSESSASRKAVLSVRTHDFAPQISMITLSGSDLPAALLPELEKVLVRYRSDLPAKVMDKLKKEKSSPKKQVKSAATETKSATPAATPTTAKADTAKVSPT
ncbi:MAG TPA: hypothetical protein VF692_12250, partial [Pyrinomonadaceae bacterium]